MRRSPMLAILTVIALLATFVFASGFWLAAGELLHPETDRARPDEESARSDQREGGEDIVLVGLGDSLTRGIGDSEGNGYFGRVRSRLKAEAGKVSAVNLAVSGAKTEDVLEQLNAPGAAYSLSRADVVLLSVGANDLFPGWENLDEIDPQTYVGDLASFRSRAEDVLEKIRSHNQDAPIFWLGLYHPFEAVEALAAASETVHRWNYEMRKIASEYDHVVIIPTYDVFQGTGTSLLHTDHFHPNERGYGLIADRVWDKLKQRLDRQGGDGDG